MMEEFEDRTGTWHAYGKSDSGRGDSLKGKDDSRNVAYLNPLSLEGKSRFSGFLATHFPEVAVNIEEVDQGVLHLEVATLTSASKEAIKNRNWALVTRHFEFVDSVLGNAEIELHDAIGISYLVNLFYNETSIDFAKARTLLPKRLAVALEIMERHYDELPR
jgi:hypothetical protein